jgi:hypothetical protein
MIRSRRALLLLALLLLAGCAGPLPPPPTGTRSQTPSVRLLPATPPPATATLAPVTPPAGAAWLRVDTAHYTFYYLPNSQAARDLPAILATGEPALETASAALVVSPTVHINVYLVNRVFWQGGASYEHAVLLISYVDPARNYVAGDLGTVLRHETTHALVEQLLGGPADKGGLLGEGVAVWAAGGHYHPEPLDVLAATLVLTDSDLYIPLTTLNDDFYGQQHEIAYLEGAAFCQFLIARYGLASFKRFLAAPADPQPIYGQSWAEIEQTWRGALAALQPTAADAQAVRLRVRYYDLMRRYETERDPQAGTLPEAAPPDWTPVDIATFSRPNADPDNSLLERDLATAGQALWNGQLTTTARLLETVAAALP